VSEAPRRLNDDQLNDVNQKAPAHGHVTFTRTEDFGAKLKIHCYRLANGLDVLLVPDGSAPVIAFHAWFKVGSRHEKPGKTGLAHLFEHLMFNEVEGLPAGEFDKRMEAAGADNNASTWLDFTQYQEAFPKAHLEMVIGLEAKRMDRLVLREPQLVSEKEVVKNERRYRVEDDVEGCVDELLWKTAYQEHPYHWPTIGWMADIEGFTTDDCRAFYETYYAPNNASLILVGDLDQAHALSLISAAYGALPPSRLEDAVIRPEPPQLEERIAEIVQPTPTEKVAIAYKSPPLSHADHVPLCLLIEVLLGGRASRIRRRLIRTEKMASDAAGYVGPHHAPSLIEIGATAREGNTAEALIQIIDEEIALLKNESVSSDELERAVARAEFGLLGGLETADGKASNIGFYQTLLGRPAAAFERLASMRETTANDIVRVAKQYLVPTSRTVIKVRVGSDEEEAAE